jgi:hypothetical protein
LGDSRAETGKQNFRDEQRIEVLRIKVSRVHISIHERLSRALVVRTLQGPFHRGRTSWAPTRRSALHQLLSPTSRTFPGCYWLNTLTATSKGIAPIVRSRPKLVVRIVWGLRLCLRCRDSRGLEPASLDFCVYPFPHSKTGQVLLTQLSRAPFEFYMAGVLQPLLMF